MRNNLQLAGLFRTGQDSQAKAKSVEALQVHILLPEWPSNSQSAQQLQTTNPRNRGTTLYQRHQIAHDMEMPAIAHQSLS